MRRHRAPWRYLHGLPRRLWSRLAHLARHPVRLAAILAMCTMLLWAVLTTTLPFVIAESAPDFALRLSPGQPTALVAKAMQLREEMLALKTADISNGERASSSQAAEGMTRAPLPVSESAAARAPITVDETNRQSARIRSLALRAIASDPLNAQSFRLLAELSNDSEKTHELMQAAFSRSRRETHAAYWLLNEAFANGKIADALRYGDVVLRTRPELAVYVMGYLGQIADDKAARPELVAFLGTGPTWRPRFFASLMRHVRSIHTPLEIMIALKETEHPATPSDLHGYLDALIANKQANAAYNAWLQMQPTETLSMLGLINNSSFERMPSGAPFDWRIERAQNAIAEFAPLADRDGSQALHIRFASGRVRFPTVSQVLVLAPSRYRLEGRLRGEITGKRGLRWRITCVPDPRRKIAETDMLLGQSRSWRTFTLEAEVPDSEDCRAQKLAIVHDARSSSEEFITGEVWFDELRLTRVLP